MRDERCDLDTEKGLIIYDVIYYYDEAVLEKEKDKGKSDTIYDLSFARIDETNPFILSLMHFKLLVRQTVFQSEAKIICVLHFLLLYEGV